MNNENYEWLEVPEVRLRTADRVIATFKTLKVFSENYIADSRYLWGKWKVSFEDGLFSPYIIEEIANEEETLYLDVIREVRTVEKKDNTLVTTYEDGYMSNFSDGVSSVGVPSAYSYTFIFKTRHTV